jgi:hypothetical protein
LARELSGNSADAIHRHLQAQVAAIISSPTGPALFQKRGDAGLGKQAYYAQIDLDQPKAYAYAKEVMTMNCFTGPSHPATKLLFEFSRGLTRKPRSGELEDGGPVDSGLRQAATDDRSNRAQPVDRTSARTDRRCFREVFCWTGDLSKARARDQRLCEDLAVEY